MTDATQLDAAIRAVCPIIGVSVGDSADAATWRIEFDPSATDAEKTAAQNVIVNWTSISQAQAAAQAQDDANASTLREQATQALANLRAFRDLSAPTNAQTVAAVKLLCAVAIGLIRLQLADFDGTD